MKEIKFEKTKIELDELERVKELARSISPRMHNVVHLGNGQKFYGRPAPWDIILVAGDESDESTDVNKSADKLV